MMIFVLQTIVLQLLLPCLMLWWLHAAGSRPDAWLRFLGCAIYFWIIRYATLWVILPFTTNLFYLACALTLLFAHHARTKPRRKQVRNSLRQLLPAGLVMIVLLALAFYIRSAREVDKRLLVTLHFPLTTGTHYVVNGGALSLLNAHHLTLGEEERFGNYRGQSYGVDLLAVNQYGLISYGILPRDPRAYVIFGEEVLAPCSGTIRAVEKSLPDLPAGERDRNHMEGNYVLLACDGFQVVLAHLQQDSLVVRPGQTVAAGQPLGRVGNSGNSDFPHLHIHAQMSAPGSAISAGDPFEIQFANRYLIRGDVVKPN